MTHQKSIAYCGSCPLVTPPASALPPPPPITQNITACIGAKELGQPPATMKAGAPRRCVPVSATGAA